MKLTKRWVFPYLVILITALILVFIWFKDGYLLGTAEAIIPFYNLNHIAEVSRWAWSEYPGLGNANEIVLAYYPTYFILSLLQQAGIPGFIIEAGVLWLVLVSAGIGIYLLTRELFPEKTWQYNIFASFFYWFNLISLVNVWNRFLFAYMFFWALLPMALFLFIKGLRLQKLSFAIGIGLLSGIFSTGLATPSFNILLWLLLIYTTVFWSLTSNVKSKLFNLKFFVSALISFTLINFWWIGQAVNYMFFGRYAQDVSSFFNDSVSLSTFNSISKDLGNLIDLFRFMHINFFKLPIVEWAKLYVFPLIIIVEFFISGIILYHILKNYRNKNVLFLGFLFIFTIFLMKGSNSPLGFPLAFLFENFSLLHFFRDPFEKFGFLLPLAAAPLLSDGLQALAKSFRSKLGRIFYISFFSMFLLLYGYPYFTSLVFTSMSPPNNDYNIGFKVKVPEYYKEADRFMKSLGNNFRYIGFPLGDEGITYKWEKGYQGVELSSVLFSSPIILFRTSVPYYDVIEQKLEELLLRSKDFIKVANSLNVKYLMLRSDIDYQERNMRNPQAINLFLEEKTKDGIFQKAAAFGKLSFWENLEWRDKTIYAVGNVAHVYPLAKITDLSFTKDSTVLSQGRIESKLEDKTNLFIIHPNGPAKIESISPEDSQLIYFFQVEEDGEYEVILDNQHRYANNLQLITDKLEFIVDNSTVIKLTQATYSLGKFNFKKGVHKITANRVVTDNIIQTSSLSLNRSNNRHELELKNFDSYARYLVDLKYLFKSPGKLIFQIAHDNDSVRNNKIVSRFTRSISSGTIFQEPQYFIDYYEPNVSANSAKIIFQSEPDGSFTDIDITNLRIRKIIDVEPILIKQNAVGSLSIPFVTYTKINPTKYIVSVKGSKGPFILVLSELFNSGWQAKFDDKALSDNHFLANAYANGWLIEKTGDFNITLEFAPQKLLDTNKIISTASFIGALFYIGSSILLKREKTK